MVLCSWTDSSMLLCENGRGGVQRGAGAVEGGMTGDVGRCGFPKMCTNRTGQARLPLKSGHAALIGGGDEHCALGERTGDGRERGSARDHLSSRVLRRNFHRRTSSGAVLAIDPAMGPPNVSERQACVGWDGEENNTAPSSSSPSIPSHLTSRLGGLVRDSRLTAAIARPVPSEWALVLHRSGHPRAAAGSASAA